MNLFNALIKSGHFYGQTNADVELGIQTSFVIMNVFSQTFHICPGEEQVSLAQALAGFGRGYIPGNQPLGKKGKKHFEQVDTMNCSHVQNSLKWAVIFEPDSRKKHKFFLSIFTES